MLRRVASRQQQVPPISPPITTNSAVGVFQSQQRPRVSLKTQRPPISDDQTKQLFTQKQRLAWPGSYRPAIGMAAILGKDGVPLSELIELRKEVAEDNNAELQRDLAYDMNVWTRCCVEQEMLSADERKKRLVKRFLARDRVPAYAEVVQFARVPSLAGERGDSIEAECRDLPGVKKTMKEIQQEAMEKQRRLREEQQQQQQQQQKLQKKQDSAEEALVIPLKKYPFTSQASLQQNKVFSVLDNVHAMSDRVVFPHFPALHNILHHHYDSCSFLKFLSARTGDDLLISHEFVRELALYLRNRVDEIQQQQQQQQKGQQQSIVAKGEEPTILFMFSNGRLPAALRDCAIPVGAKIHAVNTRRRLVRKDVVLPGLGRENTPPSFSTEFPYEILPVVDSLAKYKPLIVVGEPHSDRDWTAEMRGFHTVRELLLLGQVDSSAMCSFSYPWLSFGCAPSSDSYFVYNSLFQRVAVAPDQQFMPMDAPYLQQGYEKLYVDAVSRWMVCSNDTKDAPHQSRCCSFRRLQQK